MATLTNSILELENTIDDKNHYHPGIRKELVVPTLFKPPKMTGFPDAGPPSPGHINRLD